MTHTIQAISSLNLRASRNKANRKIDEPIHDECSFCERDLCIGADEFVLVRMEYAYGDIEREVKLCGNCVDIFADLVRKGPMVLKEISTWERMSRVVRISSVHDHMYCFNCLGYADSHVYMKFDNMLVATHDESYSTKRICAKCAICYLEMMWEGRDEKLLVPLYDA